MRKFMAVLCVLFVTAMGCRQEMTKGSATTSHVDTITVVPLPDGAFPSFNPKFNYTIDGVSVADDHGRYPTIYVATTTWMYGPTAHLYSSRMGAFTTKNDWNELQVSSRLSGDQHYKVSFDTPNHGWIITTHYVTAPATTYNPLGYSEFDVRETKDGGVTWGDINMLHFNDWEFYRGEALLWDTNKGLHYWGASQTRGDRFPIGMSASGGSWIGPAFYPKGADDYQFVQPDANGTVYLTGRETSGTSLNAIWQSTDGTNWQQFLPDQQTMLNDEFFTFGTPGGVPTAYGRNFIRTPSGYAQYPPHVAQPIHGAHVQGDRIWIVDLSQTVWFSENGGVDWRAVYVGQWPDFILHTVSNGPRTPVYFVNGRDGMWITTQSGRSMILHQYR
ncbi:hypothetical protein HY624_01935 [Candidatus Uhrbacteria bacterium]|nr:hypothetical protein [Candidatus Uhrbacteria bacterium]